MGEEKGDISNRERLGWACSLPRTHILVIMIDLQNFYEALSVEAGRWGIVFYPCLILMQRKSLARISRTI